MKILVIHDRPIDWSNPIIELDYFFGTLTNNVEPIAENVAESQYNYNLNFFIHGFRKKDLNIVIENSEIILKGNRKVFLEGSKKRKKENRLSFERRVVVSRDMDADGICARFKNGKLELVIPKKDEYIYCHEKSLLNWKHNLGVGKC